jgi:ribonuclease HI
VHEIGSGEADYEAKGAVDGSFSCSSGQGAGAVVIRNHDGVVLAAESRWYGPIHDALIAEALAARDGLYLAQQMALQNIVLESDNSVLVKMLKEDSPDRSMVAGIWHECRELCRSFANVNVCFVPREANSLADKCVCGVG